MRFPLLAWFLASCVVGITSGGAGTVLVGAPSPAVVVDEGREGRAQRNALGIPPGHLPPPGECRVWYPDRPPGHQPPVRCAGAAARAGRHLGALPPG